jgi:hypothetical protein
MRRRLTSKSVFPTQATQCAAVGGCEPVAVATQHIRRSSAVRVPAEPPRVVNRNGAHAGDSHRCPVCGATLNVGCCEFGRDDR